MKKIIKIVISRLFYLLIGLFIALTITTAYAAVSSVSSGQTLTAGLWNAMANDVNNLLTRVTSIENQNNNESLRYCIQCFSRNGGNIEMGPERCANFGDWTDFSASSDYEEAGGCKMKIY